MDVSKGGQRLLKKLNFGCHNALEVVTHSLSTNLFILQNRITQLL